MSRSMRNKSLIERNIAVNGKDWILSKCAEECCELSGAILKHRNKGSSETDILSEIADVEIALETLSVIYGREKIEAFKKNKIERIERKVREQECSST